MSQIATHCIKLDWKPFNVCLNKVNEWMIANAGESYCGNQANSQLELWFTAAPSEDAMAAIELYWEALTEDSEEAEAYLSQADRSVAMEAKKASGKAKLLALGLSEDEVQALLG